MVGVVKRFCIFEGGKKRLEDVGIKYIMNICTIPLYKQNLSYTWICVLGLENKQKIATS